MRLSLSHKFILGALAVSAAVVGFPLVFEALGYPVSPWVMPFVALAAGGSLGFAVSRQLVRNYHPILTVTDRISRGDLRAEIQVPDAGRFPDETHELSRSIAEMLENLRELVGHVQVTADRVSSCSQSLVRSVQGVNSASEESLPDGRQIAPVDGQEGLLHCPFEARNQVFHTQSKDVEDDLPGQGVTVGVEAR